MLFEHTIVGPIKSRRLGHSLGVNLLPLKHKICSYDCIYCECGWNKESEDNELEFVSPEQVRSMLEARLKELRAENAPVDSITFAGNGEPTMYPHFAQIVDIVTEMRDKYYPDAATTLLTNATQLSKPEILNAILKLDNPTLKLDAGFAGMQKLINQPNNDADSYEKIVENLIKVGSHCIIQTLLLDGENDNGEMISNIIPESYEPYVELVKKIQPKYVQLYAIDRATPAKKLRKLPVEELNFYANILEKEGIKVKVYG